MDLKTRKRVFAVVVVVSVIATMIITYTSKPAKIGDQTSKTLPTEQKTETSASKPSSGFEPSNPDDKARIERLITEFTKAVVNSKKSDTKDDFQNRVKQYLTPECFKRFGELPLAKKTANIIEGPVVSQIEDYEYDVSFTVEEFPEIEAEGQFPKDVRAKITLTVDKTSKLISEVEM